MSGWPADPSGDLERVFAGIAATRMADVPICNPQLRVEAIGFRQRPDGHWAGLMITPWGINLLCLPGATEPWPTRSSSGKFRWRFPSGEYEFTVAEEAQLGDYHLCSLFSPALEFPDHQQARLTALAVAHALFSEPIAEPADASPAESSRPASRRAFLGLGR